MDVDPNKYTEEEILEHFHSHIRSLISYWEGEKGSNVPWDYSPRQRLEGLAHSILSCLDGCSIGLPGFMVVPDPHTDDKQYLSSIGKKYYPEAKLLSGVDISGSLRLFRK